MRLEVRKPGETDEVLRVEHRDGADAVLVGCIDCVGSLNHGPWLIYARLHPVGLFEIFDDNCKKLKIPPRVTRE